MSDKPIMMTSWSVDRMLEGVKTHTSRVFKDDVECKYNIGDKLWVKERWATCMEFDNMSPGEMIKMACFCGYDSGLFSDIWYVDGEHRRFFEDVKERGKWRNYLFMPKRAARIWLEVTSIGKRRLSDMCENDFLNEGIVPDLCQDSGNVYYRGINNWFTFIEDAFVDVWNSINNAPKPIKKGTEIQYYISYPWGNIREVREHKGKEWRVNGNPCVWDIGFKVVSLKGEYDGN